MFIVDYQVHIWAADRPDRPWPKEQMRRAHLLPPFSAEDLLKEMNAAGISRVVLVPPVYDGGRNDLVLEATSRWPDRFATMGRIPVADPASRQRLTGWLDQPGMKGLRINVYNSTEQVLLTDRTTDWFFPAVERAGIPLMILAPGLLDKIDDIAQRHPSLRIILDHFAMHREMDQPPLIDLTAIEKLTQIARRPNVAVKATALPLFSAQAYPYRDLHEPIRRVFDAFGPRRVFWGTDLTRLSCTYTQAVTLFTQELPWLTESDKEWVMGRGICEWLNWPLQDAG